MAERWNVGCSDPHQCLHQSRITQIIEPQVNILGNNGCTLKRCGGKPDYQKANFVLEQ